LGEGRHFEKEVGLFGGMWGRKAEVQKIGFWKE
jgi:hypothetical protein